MAQLDPTNLRLLEMLQDDARTSIIDLARAVDRAESTVRERIASLERDGVLRGYRALVDPARLGFGARAIVRASCDRRRLQDVAKRLSSIPQVTGATITTGSNPLVIEIMAENVARLEQVLEERIAPLELGQPEVEIVLRQLVSARPLALQVSSPPAVASPAPPAELPMVETVPGAQPFAHRHLAPDMKSRAALPGAR